MPRTARIVIPGIPHHVTHRGNNRADVFFGDEDRVFYLDLMAQVAQEEGLVVLGYCLMSNHSHLVAVPERKESLARAMGRAAFRYTRYINAKLDRCGHAWGERFFSCPLDEKHTVAAMRYVEWNPVRAGLVAAPWDHPWSSAGDHVGVPVTRSLPGVEQWFKDWSHAEWRKMLAERLDDEIITKLRRETMRGRPVGSDWFIASVERAILTQAK